MDCFSRLIAVRAKNLEKTAAEAGSGNGNLLFARTAGGADFAVTRRSLRSGLEIVPV